MSPPKVVKTKFALFKTFFSNSFCLLIVTFISYLYAVYMKKVNFELNLYFLIAALNILFVLLLYISAWREMELESPIRYIYSFLVIYLIIISKSFKHQREIG